VRGALNESTRGKRRVSAPASGLDVRYFPAAVLPAGTQLYRIHREGFDPWWFSHDGSQRFDLPRPWGACYVAQAPVGAFLETLTRLVIIPAADVAIRRLATITLTQELRLADCQDPAAASYGVTATTSAGYPYERESHPWARRFWRAGFDGVRYGAAHHPALAETSYALFGRSDQATSYGDVASGPIPAALLEEAQTVFGFRVVGPTT
jgi:hypothetical protein